MEKIFNNDFAKDQVAFQAIYLEYHQAVYANITKLVKDQSVAEDILQEVFFSFWQNRNKMDQKKSPSGWLFVVSYNKSLNYLKKKVHESITYLGDYEGYHQITEDAPVDEALFDMQLQVLEEAVASLSPQRQKVFRMCKYEGKSLDEVALILNLSKESVKDYLKQSKHLIKAYVANRKLLDRAVSVSLLIMLAAN